MSIKFEWVIMLMLSVFLAAVSYKAGNEIEELSANLAECNNFTAQLQASIAKQNAEIDAANKQLGNYAARLAENNETWSKRLEAQKKKIRSVKGCDEFLGYLKQMVEGLK